VNKIVTLRLELKKLTPLGTPTPLVPDLSDEEMIDADIPQSTNSTPQAEEEEPEDEEPEDAATPAQESEAQSRPATPQMGRVSAIPRKRRLGRPPKNRPPDYDDGANNDAVSDVGTPSRGRGRGRGRGGGRWGKPRGGPSHVTQVPIDKEGNMMDVIDDEVALPEDPEGEEKVDKMGNLLGGRDYRVRVFTIYGRGERLYMLSTEPARCIGFRDSYLFFQKHRLLYKIIISEDEKRDLIERELIPHSYKGRAIGVVTARSVFREFGAKIIIGGKKVIDDYHAQAARMNGDIEGELAVPEDKLPPPGEPYNKNQYVAWFGASSVYHSGAPSVPMPSGADGKKRKVVVTGDNWMLEHARAAS
jgi:chromatin structure-remodeling complex protein RSC7